jgi:hypothetical protein
MFLCCLIFDKRTYCMKKYLNVLACIALSSGSLLSIQATAEEMDEIVVTAPRYTPQPVWFPGGGPGNDQGPGGSGGASGGGAKEPDKPTLDETLASVIKKAKDLCKKSSEDCGSWGSRMTNPVATGGSGFCVNISATYPLIGTSLCIQSVNREVNLNSCANVGCP